MATFDRSYGYIVVRVVYDGPSGAGKTANLKQLVQTFSAQRRGALSSPRQVDETTAYFDWLSLNGGVVGGYPLRAQLVTTPGRDALSRRRWHLVEQADVIVFVTESTPAALKVARRSLELLRVRLSRSSLGPPIIVQANKQDAPGALSTEAIADALGLPPGAEVVPAQTSDGIGVRETVVRAIRCAAALADRDVVARGVDALDDTEDEHDLLGRLDGSTMLRAAVEHGDLPALPDEDADGRDVWPERSGRAVLRALARGFAAGAFVPSSTSPDAVSLRASGFFVTSSRVAADAGRDELRARARALIRLGALSTSTTLAIARAPGAWSWLWAITPCASTLEERLDAACTGDDEARLTEALEAYARALAAALALAVRDDVGLDVAPARFGEVDGRVVYLSDRLTAPSVAAVAEAARAIPARCARWPAAVDAYRAALDATLARRGPLLARARAEVLAGIAGPHPSRELAS